MAIKKHNCSDTGHDFKLASPDDNTRIPNDDGGTEIWRTFICSKCGATIDRKTATWAKRSKHSSNTSTSEEF
jgi:hypothetical protein